MKCLGSLFIGMLFYMSLNALYAQNIKAPCKCEQDFAYTINYLENHYSGFQDNITEANREQYNKLKQDILSDIQAHQTPDMVCLAFMKRYLEFFRDNHLQIWGSGMEVDESKPESIAKFKESDAFKTRERISYDSASVYEYLAKSQDPIEGVYQTGIYEFAVLKNQNSLRDYYGVMIRSTSPLWEQGQIKLDLKRLNDHNFQSILYMRNHSLNVRNLTSEAPIFDLFSGVQKKFPKQEFKETARKAFSFAPEGDWFQFKVLNDSTHYVHIKTFNGSLQTKFDSVYKQIIPIIKTKPYLIIDIRDNGGGSDNNWKPLAQLAYTAPYEYDKTYVFCTTETIKRYEEMLEKIKQNQKDYGKSMIKWAQERIALMRKAPLNTFTPIIKYKGKNKYRKQKRVEPTPKKIVLIYNRNSGSAAEGLILDAMHSKKVITFGENSGGYITFGNVMTILTPQLKLNLQTATQKTPNRFEYEKMGIPPQVRANNNEDWLIQALNLLKSK